MQKLPVDISTFPEMRRKGYLYVDKTKQIYTMLTSGRRYFLARPRRFGKSLLVSTLQAILEGRRELFQGLWIADSDYDWTPHAVIVLDFSMFLVDDLESWRRKLRYELKRQASLFDVTIDTNAGEETDLLLRELIYGLKRQGKEIALLIDEYDSPLTKMLHRPDIFRDLHEDLKQFFSVIKALDAQLPFVFITGVSAFAKAGLFSGINNLQMMMLDPQYSSICGYTEEEVKRYFTPYLAVWAAEKETSLEQKRLEIQHWYNGYSFGIGVEKVYNPFSLLNALKHRELGNYWFESGTPELLIRELKLYSQREDANFVEMKPQLATKEELTTFYLEEMPLPALMFQTGYITIVDYDNKAHCFILNYPNIEVAHSWQIYMLIFFTDSKSSDITRYTYNFQKALQEGDLASLVANLKKLFAHIPYQLHIAKEAFYHALLHMAFTVANLKVQSEYSISHGRIDLVVELAARRYIIEVKFNTSAIAALQQIEKRKYFRPFQGAKPLTLIGLAFDKTESHFDITYAAKDLGGGR